MLKSLTAGTLVLLLAATAVAGVTGVVPVAAPDLELPAQDGIPLDVAALVQEKVAAAGERATAALDHADSIRLWTACIVGNAADPEAAPRDDDFDPKVGCEALRPEPPAGAGNTTDDPESVEVLTGAPDGAGVPDGVPPVAPPDGVPPEAAPPAEVPPVEAPPGGVPPDAGAPEDVPGPPPGAGPGGGG